MAKLAREGMIVTEFPGLLTGPDATDLPAGGAVLQDNVMSAHEGELRSRPGYRPVVFEEE